MTTATYDLKQFWATPVLSVLNPDLEKLNSRLAEIILEKEEQIIAEGNAVEIAGIAKGLTANWMDYNVLNWDYPECRQLREIILDGLRAYIKSIGDPDDPGLQIAGISCWANVLRHGDYLGIHHHDPGYISAHYCVQTGLAEGEAAIGNSGHTLYFRPGFMERSMGGEAAGPTSPWDSQWMNASPPRAGKLFFFPSYVRHEVRPHLGSKERITIAMDVYLANQSASQIIYFAPPRWFVPA